MLVHIDPRLLGEAGGGGMLLGLQQRRDDQKRRRVPQALEYHGLYASEHEPPSNSGRNLVGIERLPRESVQILVVLGDRVQIGGDTPYKKHLYAKRLTFDALAGASVYQVQFLTNRQKRLVAYYKIFRHIYTKGKYKVVLALPPCVCQMIRKWWPDDGDDRRLRGVLLMVVIAM